MEFLSKAAVPIWQILPVNFSLNALQFFLLLVFLSTVLLYRWKKARNFTKYPPGPVGLPIFGYLPFLGKEPHKALLDLSKKYKSSIISLRMGTKLTVVLNDYEVTKETVCHPAALGRAPNLFHHIPDIGFISKSGAEWQEQRRFSLFSMRDLGFGRGEWENLVQEGVEDFMQELALHKGKSAEISHQLSCAISNNVLSLLIGRRLQKGAEDDKIETIVQYSDVSFTYMGPSDIASLIPALWSVFKVLGIAGYNRVSDIIYKFRELVVDEMEKHKSLSEYKNVADFINMYLEKMKTKTSTEDKHFFTEKMLEGNVKILFLAASDTIFSSLSWLFCLMAEHPDVQKKAQAELDEVIGKDGKVTYEERFKVPYTFAVMMEAQRFGSIVPLSTTRCAITDFEIRGYTIPKGAEITSNLWALHYDKNYWDKPEEFKPERFLTEDSKVLRSPQSFAPFSIGRRNCPGETVAWMEILAFFTTTLQRFNIQKTPGKKINFDIVNGLVAHLKHQPLCFVERTERV